MQHTCSMAHAFNRKLHAMNILWTMPTLWHTNVICEVLLTKTTLRETTYHLVCNRSPAYMAGLKQIQRKHCFCMPSHQIADTYICSGLNFPILHLNMIRPTHMFTLSQWFFETWGLLRLEVGRWRVTVTWLQRLPWLRVFATRICLFPGPLTSLLASIYVCLFFFAVLCTWFRFL